MFGQHQISHVLFVPKMNCTLISVACLMKDLNCIVTFVDKLCVIRDRTTRTLIGEGEQHGGVYLFRSTEQGYANRAKGVDDMVLWHSRLRHPSKYRVSLILDVTNKSRTIDEPCDVCFRAKQT